MKRLIALVLLIVCCNTWAFGFNKVESDVVEPFWVAKVSVDGMTVVFVCNRNKENCKCFTRNINSDNNSIKEFQCPELSMEKK